MATNKSKTGYVDGFVFAVPKKNLAAYKKMAREGAAAWKKCGALDYKECMGNDLVIKKMKGMPSPMSFTKLAKVKANETVWFSYITFKSKAHRNEVNKKVMALMNKMYEGKENDPMPFDPRRMAYGGFSVEVG